MLSVFGLRFSFVRLVIGKKKNIVAEAEVAEAEVAEAETEKTPHATWPHVIFLSFKMVNIVSIIMTRLIIIFAIA